MENQENIIITPSPQAHKDVVPDGRSYTPISNAICDCRTIRILKNLLSGKNGELTGLHSYLYQNILTNNVNENLANALNNILLEELLHARLLGNAILAFGGNPRFSNGQGSFWSTRNVNYSTNPTSFINENILREQRAINNYQEAITRVTNPSLQQLFREIIDDKNRHIQILQRLL